MILSEKIIRLRKKNGWSQEELAYKMNVSRQAVSKWESAQTVPDIENILLLGELFGVTTDYLLKDDIKCEEYSPMECDTHIRKMSLEEASKYIALRKKASVLIAIAIMLCILSVFPLIILGAASEMLTFGLSEDLAGIIGLVTLILIVAVAVPIFISVGFSNEPFEFIEKQPFETEYGVIGLVKDAQKKFRKTYIKLNYLGASICILSPIPLFITSALTNNDFTIVISLISMMFIAGIGTMLFVIAGVRWASMQKILKEGEYHPIQNKKSNIRESIGAIYWAIVLAIFLLWSFIDNNGNSWIVWPVAAVLFAAVMTVCSFVIDKKDE